MSLGTVLLIVLILILVGAIPTSGFGYGNGVPGALGVVILILLVLLLTGRL